VIGSGAAEAIAHFAPRLSSVPDVRRFCFDALDGGVDDALRDDAVLVVSELAANSVRHAGGHGFTVTVQHLPDGVLLRVNDRSSQPPTPAQASVMAESGRGLDLVGQVATAWGSVSDGEGGKAVWAVLHGVAVRESRRANG
jgi:hypothetical protein